jgi:hypothetical protein
VYVSVLEYEIQGINDEGWSKACDELAPAFAAVPGLLSKIWLHGEGDLRGGVYVWDDRPAFDGFLASDLGRAVRAHPNIADLTIRTYAVDEAPTRVTFGSTSSTSSF